MLIVLHCWTLLQASMNPNNNNAKCSQTSYNKSVRQIEGQEVILWSPHACGCLPQLTRLIRVATRSTRPTQPTWTPTRPNQYQIGHQSQVASRVNTIGGQLGQLGLDRFLKHWQVVMFHHRCIDATLRTQWFPHSVRWIPWWNVVNEVSHEILHK